MSPALPPARATARAKQLRKSSVPTSPASQLKKLGFGQASQGATSVLPPRRGREAQLPEAEALPFFRPPLLALRVLLLLGTKSTDLPWPTSVWKSHSKRARRSFSGAFGWGLGPCRSRSERLGPFAITAWRSCHTCQVPCLFATTGPF